MKDTNELKYVLYARKSSESDERQAISIDGQLMEMKGSLVVSNSLKMVL